MANQENGPASETVLTLHNELQDTQKRQLDQQRSSQVQTPQRSRLNKIFLKLFELPGELIQYFLQKIIAMSTHSDSSPTENMSQNGEKQFQVPDSVLDLNPSEVIDCKNADTDGVLLWKITEVRRKRREAVSGKTHSFYSRPFYTSRYGYKVCAKLYLNGDGVGKGTHLSLFIVIMKGEQDYQLPWPFAQEVTMVLIDQSGDHHIADTFKPDQSSSCKRPQSERNMAIGCPLFVSLNTLDDTRCMYVKDDAMFIKIVVDTNISYKTVVD
jgi:hypothetical protein